MAVIVGIAIVVSNRVADELRRSATESAVHNVEAIVRGYVDPDLQESSLDLDAPHDTGNRRAARTADSVGRDPPDQHLVRDGRIVYSNVAELRGRRFSITPQIANAYAGDGVARYVGGDARPDRG